MLKDITITYFLTVDNSRGELKTEYFHHDREAANVRFELLLACEWTDKRQINELSLNICERYCFSNR